MKFCVVIVMACLLATFSGKAQDVDLLHGLDSGAATKQYVEYAFKSPRVIMSHSIQMLKPGVLDFRILHRFGFLNSGIGQFFGLDQATMRMSFDYGISQNLTAGIGRSTYKKELDGFLKYRLVQQSMGVKAFPLSIVVVGGSTIQTGKSVDPTRKKEFSSRLSYYGQVMMGKKFNENFSLQLSPMMVHQNLVPLRSNANDLYALGAGERFKISKRVALTADYFYVFNRFEGMRNPLSIGVDIETGGHVFQLHFTNATGMNERAFIAETSNDWGAGQVQFGFNLSRVFQVKK